MHYTTLNGLMRFEVRQWWAKIFVTGYRSRVGVYNSGHHLYIDTGLPGRFIDLPEQLRFFPFMKVREQIGEVNVLHGGHVHTTPSDVGYGQALVFITTSSSILRMYI
jgi:hypothetical protein